MKKEIEIKLPKSVYDLRMKHLELFTYEKLQDFAEGKEMQMHEVIKIKCKVLSIASGVESEKFQLMPINEVNKMFNHVCELISDYSPEPFKREVTFNNQTYSLVDPSKVSVGWHIDLSSVKQNDYLNTLALMYLPKDVPYGKTDENLNVLHPISERRKVFEENFRLVDYLNVNAFFLQKSMQLTKGYTVLTEARKQLNANRIRKKKNGLKRFIGYLKN
jgi:hypothetical protein